MKLDRTRQVDLRSLNYRIETKEEYTPRSYTWKPGTVLDQGREGACVGFGWTHELGARPAMVKNANADLARSIYHEAQTIDEWPGETYEGTSVLAGAKVAKRRGYITEYRWCLDMNDLIVSLGYHGPVVIGVDWYTDMFDTDKDGYIRPTGKIEGGHCVMLNKIRIAKNADGSVDYLKSYVGGINSWGESWGDKGRFRMSLIDVAKLFPGGDFAVPMGRKIPLLTRLSQALR